MVIGLIGLVIVWRFHATWENFGEEAKSIWRLWCGLSLNVNNGWVGLGLHYSEKGAQRVEMWA